MEPTTWGKSNPLRSFHHDNFRISSDKFIIYHPAIPDNNSNDSIQAVLLKIVALAGTEMQGGDGVHNSDPVRGCAIVSLAEPNGMRAQRNSALSRIRSWKFPDPVPKAYRYQQPQFRVCPSNDLHRIVAGLSPDAPWPRQFSLDPILTRHCSCSLIDWLIE